MNRSKIEQFRHDVRTLKRGCAIVKHLSPGYLFLSLLSALINAFIPYISIYMLAVIIDELTHRRNFAWLMIYVGVTIGGTLFMNMISHLISRQTSIMSNMFESRFQNYMNNVKLSLKFSQMEDSKCTELREKIMANMFAAHGGITYVVGNITSIFQNIISVITAIVVSLPALVVSYHTQSSLANIINSGWFTLILLVVITLSIYFNVKNATTVNKKVFELYQDGASTNGYLEYYQDIYLEDDQAGKDVRIFNQKELIREEILQKGRLPWLHIVSSTYGLNRKYFSINSALSALMGGIIYLFAGLRALTGSVSIGNVTKTYAAINNLVNSIGLLSVSFTRLRSNNKYLELLYEFLNLPKEEFVGRDIPSISNDNWEIEFHNVSFRYPSSETYTLKNLSFKLTSNSRTAIVGRNGSGKTTMIKLMCRFYQPDSGYITLNGKNINDFDFKAYMDLISVVFQDFQLLAFSIGENLAASASYEEDKAWEALKTAGINERMDRFPRKLEQYVYRRVDENGVDVSGGEAQKIAIARAVYKNAPIVILDEPTSALDPVSEADIYSKFNELIGNKTTVYISHRLSSCRFCDSILVFEEGEIVQVGAHDELINDLSGRYYELWNAQAQHYVS